MRLHRSLLLALLFAGVGTVSIAQPAFAVPYPAVPPVIVASTATVSDGGQVAFDGNGFAAGEPIVIDLVYVAPQAAGARTDRHRATGGFVTVHFAPPRAVVKTINAETDGTFHTTVTLTTPGIATVTARGTMSGVTAVATVTVLAAAAADSGNGPTLARTGTDGRLYGWGIGSGLVAILLGAGLIGITVKRRRRTDG